MHGVPNARPQVPVATLRSSKFLCTCQVGGGGRGTSLLTLDAALGNGRSSPVGSDRGRGGVAGSVPAGFAGDARSARRGWWWVQAVESAGRATAGSSS